MPKEVDVHLDPVADGIPTATAKDYVFPVALMLAGLLVAYGGDISHGLTVSLFGVYAYYSRERWEVEWIDGYYTGAESASEQVAEQVGAERR